MRMRHHWQNYQNRTPKMASKAFNIREVWNPVCCHDNKTAMLILWSTSSRILLQRIKHFWYKLGYLFPSYLIIIRLSLWRHHLANLHILKTWISLEQKDIFENSKQNSSSRTDYTFMSLNGLNRKHVIFIIAALFGGHFVTLIVCILRHVEWCWNWEEEQGDTLWCLLKSLPFLIY